jgi:diguanylate cyclase (GGDEF)-like protein
VSAITRLTEAEPACVPSAVPPAVLSLLWASNPGHDPARAQRLPSDAASVRGPAGTQAVGGTEKVTEKMFLADQAPGAGRTGRAAFLVHIYPTGPAMGSRYALADSPLVIGRGEECDIRIEHDTVSRRHIRVAPSGDGYAVSDLGSTNGTFVNNTPVTRHQLHDGDYLRVGKCIYRFLAGGNVEAEYHEEIYRLAIIDALTNLHNKRYLVEFLQRELARSERRSAPLSLVLFDIDHFKHVNDSLGHLAGDLILRALAARTAAAVRKDELLARYGGEEFALVLPDTDRGSAAGVAERLRALVAGQPFHYNGADCPVTVSLGVATTGGDASHSLQELIEEADRKLYEAKNLGRNCVCA